METKPLLVLSDFTKTREKVGPTRNPFPSIFLNNTTQEKVVTVACISVYVMLFKAYCLLIDHASAIHCGRRLPDFLRGFSLRTEEGELTHQLAKLYQHQSKYKEAKGLFKKALGIITDTGNKKEIATCYGNLGSVCQSLGEYGKAEEYQRKALAIRKEIGDREGEAACYGNLGTVYHSLGEYAKAEEYLSNALGIERQLGNKQGEANCYGNLYSKCRVR